ncbi:hypothetical protein SAMD00019534_017220, partial [Acytostelium subglobosum LB1]|uniref:hypothetical protein n=1 Tax=Acytostelium subglobosum LB1 TaxID=1410327 RepID=UPI000644CB71
IYTPINYYSMAFTTSKTVVFDEYGDASKLYVKELPIRIPSVGEVRVKIAAVGLNRAETMYRSGIFYDLPTSFPASIGYEGAGVVDALGPGVTNFKVGDKVAILTTNLMSKYSTNMEYAIFPEESLVLMNEGQTFVEAASLWTAYLTAYFALVEVHKVTAGQVVVVNAASSSTGLAAIQLVISLGATVIATSRSSAKRQQLLDLGAHHFIATKEENVAQRINEITNNFGANVIYDPVAGPMVAELVTAMAPKGTYIIYGVMSPDPTPFPINSIIFKFINFKAYAVLEFSFDPVAIQRAVTFLRDRLPTFRSIIGKVFQGIESTPSAHQYLDGSDLFGKVVIE